MRQRACRFDEIAQPFLEHVEGLVPLRPHAGRKRVERVRVQRLGGERRFGALGKGGVQLRRPAPERLRCPEVPLLERCEEGRGRGAADVRFARLMRLRRRPARARGRPLVVAAELVDRVVPPRALMPDHRLNDGERARIEPGTVVFDRPGERWHACEAVLPEKAPDLELGVWRGFDPAEQFQHPPVIDKRQAVALIARASRPAAFRTALVRQPFARTPPPDATADGRPLGRAIDQLQQAIADVVVA